MKPPPGWKAATVADICKMRNGRGFGPADWDTVGLPIIRIQNLNGGRSFDYYSGVAESNWLVEPGQLLFAWAGTRGVSFGPTVWRGPLGVLNQHIFKVEALAHVDKGWLYWVLRHVTDRIEAQAHGFKATLVHVKKSDIDQQSVTIPPRPEQRRIARILSTWHRAIAITERLLANSRKQTQILAHQALTGKRRLDRFDKGQGSQPTPHGPIPKDWRYRQIQEVSVEVSTKLGSAAPHPVLSCTKHSGLVDSLRYFNKQVFSKDTSTYKVVPKDCFVYATNHIEEGSIGYQDLYEFGLVSPMYTVFKTDSSVCDSYLYRLLKTEHYRQIFAAATNASVDRRGSLRWNEFKKLRIPFPPRDEQEAIASLLIDCERETLLLKSQLESLQTEKAALVTQLLTGKRRVLLPEIETEAEAAP